MRCHPRSVSLVLLMLISTLSMAVHAEPVATSRGTTAPAAIAVPVVPGYIRDLPSESKAARAARHAAVARRLVGTPILVHRGASRIAPENTLEAYAAAMDRGADGVEIDIRRSADGVLLIHHDEDLGRTIEGHGRIADLTYYELLHRRLKIYGAADKSTRVPTLASVLHLARQRAMLLHLDIKEPGIEGEITKLLEEADVWDHVVHINDYNAADLRRDVRFKPLTYKGWFEEARASDMDRQRFLARPQRMIFVGGDPAEATKLLGRPVRDTVPISKDVRIEWTPDGPAATRPATEP